MRAPTNIGPYYFTGTGQFPGLPQLPGLPGVGLPGVPGTGVPGVPAGLPGFHDVLDLLTAGVPQLGVFTPWAEQVNEMSFQEISAPALNISAMDLTGAKQAMGSFGLGAPGFVAVITEKPVGRTVLQAAFEATPYAYFESVAAYRQDDAGAPPRIYFVHWGSLRDPGTGGAQGSIEAMAAALGGQSVFAVQVPADQSTVRMPPAVAFSTAYGAQFGQPANGQPPPTIPPSPEPPPPDGGPPAPVPPDQPPPGPPPRVKAAGVSQYFFGAAIGLGVAAVVTYAVIHWK